MARIELSGGQWAEFREDIEDLPNGELRPLIVAINEMIYGRAPGEASVASDEILLRLLVVGWSFERPIPSQAPDSLSLISGRHFAELAKAAQPYYATVTSWGKTDAADPTKVPSPKSSTSSGASPSTGEDSPTPNGSSTAVPLASAGAGGST